MAKVLVLLSGGIDSTVCATWSVNLHGSDNVEALTMYYGQKHVKEIDAAKEVAKALGIKHRILQVPEIFEDSKSSLIDPDNPHPVKTYEELDTSGELSSAYVPFRNGVFLSIAAAIAQKEEFDIVCYGPHKELGGIHAYPDCSPKFNTYMREAIAIGTAETVQLETPLQDKTKTEVVKCGDRIGAPLHLTWTCYYSGEEQCGECPACLSRDKAIKEAGLEGCL